MSVFVMVPIENVIICTANDGGYKSGQCTACGATGYWDNQYGYPFGTPESTKLVHKEGCDLGGKLQLHVTVKEE